MDKFSVISYAKELLGENHLIDESYYIEEGRWPAIVLKWEYIAEEEERYKFYYQGRQTNRSTSLLIRSDERYAEIRSHNIKYLVSLCSYVDLKKMVDIMFMIKNNSTIDCMNALRHFSKTYGKLEVSVSMYNP